MKLFNASKDTSFKVLYLYSLKLVSVYCLLLSLESGSLFQHLIFTKYIRLNRRRIGVIQDKRINLFGFSIHEISQLVTSHSQTTREVEITML